VRAGSILYNYRPRDLRHGELWSRIARGNALDLTLRVPVSERSQVKFEIVSFQAGYRGLGGGTVNHPHYDQILQAAAGAVNASCVVNYACDITANNTAPGKTTLGLVIGNLFQCTGVLLNDVPGDNTPYVLTARHCQSGKLGGGNPGAATGVTVYWDASSTCGQALGSLYDPGIVTQSGATTVVEQQDMWLLKLDESPLVTDAYLAGFDATGASVQGGYTIDHALGYDKQLTDWFGTAYAEQESGVLGVSYLSDFLEVVNATGNIGPGASGSALFDQNNRLVGTLSLGRSSGDSSGYQSCPAASPSAPNGNNGTADFTALAATWNTTSDTTSSTGTATLQNVLDPANTGTRIVNSSAAVYVTLTASANSLPVGTEETLTWNAPGASACTATDGVAGDGWTGSFASHAAMQISEAAAAEVTYGLDCAFADGRYATAIVTATWGSPTPKLTFTSSFVVWTTRPATLTWTSNVSPCTLAGGSLALSDLPSSGVATTTQSTPGDVTYTISCGTGNDVVTANSYVQYQSPSMQLTVNGTDRLLGEVLTLQWRSYADSCAPSGGAPNDGWSTTQFADPSDGPSFSLTAATLGTYTYTLTCSSGSISVQKQVSVTFENGAPFVTVSVDRTSSVYTGSSTNAFQVSWNSNLNVCSPSATPLPAPLEFVGSNMPEDFSTAIPLRSGTVVLSVTCDGLAGVSATSTPITLTVAPAPPATATLAISPSSVFTGQTFTITFGSTNTANCVGSTNSPDVPFNLDTLAGTASSVSEVPGTYTFSIACTSVDPTQAGAQAHAALIVTAAPPPAVTVTATPATVMMGQPFAVNWTWTHATSCAASGGGASSADFVGPLSPTSKSEDLTAMNVGTFTYTVTCSSSAGTAHASAIVTVTSPASGGGVINLLELLTLGAVAAWRRGKYARTAPPTFGVGTGRCHGRRVRGACSYGGRGLRVVE